MKIIGVGSYSDLGKKIKTQFNDRHVAFLHDIPSLDIKDYHSVKYLVLDYPDVISDIASDTVEKAEEHCGRKVKNKAL